MEFNMQLFLFMDRFGREEINHKSIKFDLPRQQTQLVDSIFC